MFSELGAGLDGLLKGYHIFKPSCIEVSSFLGKLQNI